LGHRVVDHLSETMLNKKVAIRNGLPLKAACHDDIFKLHSFWCFAPELQRSPMPFHLHSVCGTTLMTLAYSWQ